MPQNIKSKRKNFFVLFFFALVALVFLAPFLLGADGNDPYRELPYSGKNFTAYGRVPHLAGRCYLLAPVSEILLEAYEELETQLPDRKFIYLEMGWNGGGKFSPHRTHQDGRSADFLTPMRDQKTGFPKNLPISPRNRWGYDLRLSADGKYEDLVMDEVAVIGHLAALEKAARRKGWRIERVILDPPLVAMLRKNAEYPLIRNIAFMKGHAWVPHDGHYHVDFVKARK